MPFSFLRRALLDILPRSRGNVDVWYVGDKTIRCDYTHAQAANFLDSMLYELRRR